MRLVLGYVLLHTPILAAAAFIGWFYGSIPYAIMALIVGAILFQITELGASLIDDAIEADWNNTNEQE